MTKRKYKLGKRAERQQETRARIVDAAVCLHEEVGPAATTISAIAERAGVERLTVYRHFPDEWTLFGACSSKYMDDHPLPSTRTWDGVSDPEKRTRAALSTLYAYYRTTRRMFSRVTHDLERVPALHPVMEEIAADLDAISTDIATAWKPSAAKRQALEGVTSHAVQFSTWETLDRSGFDDEEMAALVALWCRAIKSSRSRTIGSIRTERDRGDGP